MTHIVCVDAYEGSFEPVVGAGTMRPAGLALPWDVLADRLNATVTVLDWRAWYEYEERGDSPAGWMTFPATRPVGPYRAPRSQSTASSRVRRQSVPVLDPEDDRPLGHRALSKRAHGMLAEGDPLFLLSVVLHRTLIALGERDGIDLLVLPMWGGLGYVAQLEAQAADGPLGSTATAVVVTSTSRQRLAANQEGSWTRPAIARIQREELSLALADVALSFGTRGVEIAYEGRLRTSRPPQLAPRQADGATLAALTRDVRASTGPVRFTLSGPSDGASGALALLDAARRMTARDVTIECPGDERVFAPMAPRSFRDYWSSRAWVRELEREGRWRWGRSTDQGNEVRLHVGAFAHLDDPLPSLATSGIILLSPAAADAVPGVVPELLLLPRDPDAGLLSERLERLAMLPPDEIHRLRSALINGIVEGARGADWEARLDQTVQVLRSAMRVPRSVSIGQVMKRQVDPRRPLAELDATPIAAPATAPATLSVVVPSHGVGGMLDECIASVWASTRVPDEVIIVDDGSVDAATLDAMERVSRDAVAAGRSLRILRQANRGLAGARNAGLHAAEGTYISFLDADDLIGPGFFEVAVALLEREPVLGAVAAWADIFGDEVAFWNAPQAELPLLLVENQVIVPAVTRSALLRSLGGYDERQRYNYEDWELGVRMLAHGHPILTLPRYLMRYRVRGDSLYRTMTPIQHQVMRERMFATHAATVASFPAELALQLEHRLALRVFTRATDPGPVTPVLVQPLRLRGAARAARLVLERAAAGLRRMTGN